MVNRRTIFLSILLGLSTILRGFSALPRTILNESGEAITVFVNKGKEFGEDKEINFTLQPNASEKIETGPDFALYVGYSDIKLKSFRYEGSRHELNSLTWKGPNLITISDNAITPDNSPDKNAGEIPRLNFGGISRPNFNRSPSPELS